MGTVKLPQRTLNESNITVMGHSLNNLHSRLRYVTLGGVTIREITLATGMIFMSSSKGIPNSMSRPQDQSLVSSTVQTTSRIAFRQVKFPSFMRGVTESLIFCSVFLASGYVSLGLGITAMLVPMVPIVLIMMLSMVFSGVYRPEVSNSIMHLYIRSAYGYVLGSVLFVITVHLLMPEYATLKFEFFFLFSSFFVMNTVRPIISGTDFMDGGGRRTN